MGTLFENQQSQIADLDSRFANCESRVGDLEDKLSALELRYEDMQSGKKWVEEVRQMDPDKIAELFDSGKATLIRDLR